MDTLIGRNPSLTALLTKKFIKTMKAKIKNLTDELIAAVGPVFARHQDYDDIFAAMCLVMARVIQSTPDRGEELLVMEDAYTEIKHALTQFLAIEHAKENQAKVVAEGIDGFAGLARPAEQPVIEPGSAGDHPDNPNQNIAKTVAPFRDQKGNLTQEGFDQLKQDVVKLHTPDSGPTIDKVIGEEAEQAKQDTYKEEP